MISLEPYSESLVLAGDPSPIGWSPDGKYLYAVLDGGEVIRLRSSAPNEISTVAALPGNVVNYDSAAVSPDGRQIVVSLEDQRSDVWLMEHVSN